MAGEHFIERLLEDERLVGSLDDPEAALLVERLTDRALAACQRAQTLPDAERGGGRARPVGRGERAVGMLRQFGRDVSDVVSTWRDEGPARAAELARQCQLPWPPPDA